MTVVDDVAAVLPPPGQYLTAKEIHQLVDRWAFVSIRLALLKLIQAGVVVRIPGKCPKFARAQ